MRAIPKADRLALLALVLLVVALFRESVLQGGVFYKRDIHLIWHPQVEGFVRAVFSGALPLWDPSPAFGQPLLADPATQVLYPPTWLNLLMRPWTYYTLFAFGHVLLSGIAFHALARRWGLSRGRSPGRRVRLGAVRPVPLARGPLAPLRERRVDPRRLPRRRAGGREPARPRRPRSSASRSGCRSSPGRPTSAR